VAWEFDGTNTRFSVVGLAITQIVTEFNKDKYLQLSGENELTFG
jgi:hypothetical protein